MSCAHTGDGAADANDKRWARIKTTVRERRAALIAPFKTCADWNSKQFFDENLYTWEELDNMLVRPCTLLTKIIQKCAKTTAKHIRKKITKAGGPKTEIMLKIDVKRKSMTLSTNRHVSLLAKNIEH